jgi:beta-lactamase regulating signal transducer with metallopeptidase domain
MSDPAVALRAAAGALEAFGSGVVERFAMLNVWTAAMLAGAVAFDRALAHRTRAGWRVALYAPIALRLVTPLDWGISLAGSRAEVLIEPLRIAASGAAGDAAEAHLVSWRAIAGALYVVVAAALAARTIAARVRLNRALDGGRAVKTTHAGTGCDVLLHDEIGPMAVGLVAPRVVIPRRLFAPGEEHALACVLGHEAAHLRRRDAWLSAGMQVLAVVAWPVAPLWIATARVRQLVELACDEAALEGADADARRRYGHALLDMAEHRWLPAPMDAGALHFGSTLRARIEALASRREWPRAAQAFVLGLAPLALFVACSGGAATGTGTTSAALEDKGYGYEFDKDTPAEAASSAPKNLPTRPDGRIPPETVQTAVRSHFTAMKACYEAGLAKDPKLAGRVVAKYEFDENGATTKVEDEGSTMPDKAVVACVLDEFRHITYPAAPGGVVTVVYPIEFAP